MGQATAPAGPRLSITLANRQVTNPVIVSYEARPATMRANRELIAGTNGKPPERSTRHIEIALTGSAGYHTGYHDRCRDHRVGRRIRSLKPRQFAPEIRQSPDQELPPNVPRSPERA